MKVEPWRVRFLDEKMQDRYVGLRQIFGEPNCCQVDKHTGILYVKWLVDLPGLAQRIDITAEHGYKILYGNTTRRLLETVHPHTSHLSDGCALLASPEPLRRRA